MLSMECVIFVVAYAGDRMMVAFQNALSNSSFAAAFFSLTLVLFFTKLLIQMDNKIDDSAFNVDFECTRNCCVEIKQKKTRPIRIHRERKPSEK